ncbi:MAG TPA: toll/interleukin-1 receptor domain-containing protein [Ktedonobacterales bacterium]|jgi:Flp pilus assembly protein TadD
MAEQLRVFVSHSHEDDAFCRAVMQALREAGADVWYDEHNLGSGQLMSVIQRELGIRPIFVVILSKHAFASRWVKRETTWAYEMYDRDPSRLILPVTAGQFERDDFSPQNEWLFLHDFKRIEAPGYAPYPPEEAARRLARTLGLTPRGEAPAPVAPQATESVDDLLARGKALNAQKKYAEALPLFERASQIAPGSLDAWGNLGFILSEQGRWQESLTACDHALALDDKQASVWNNKGRALYNLKRYDEAIVACDRALARNPNSANTWTTKGAALGNLGRYQEELAAYDRALALDPNHANAWNNKAISLRALGRTAEAEAAEKRAKELGWTG